MKHGIIVKTRTAMNEEVWIILKDGSFDSQIITWQQMLYAQDRSPNTVRSYVYDLSKLWDFQHEYKGNYDLEDPSDVVKMLSHFKRALLHGDEELGWEPSKKTSVKRRLNAINSYIDFSVPMLSNPLIRSVSWFNKKNAKKDGFFAHLREPSLQPSVKRLVRVKIIESNWDMKYFPFRHIKDFILHELCARNRCLYALLAMGGLRLSEALNLWIDDVFFQGDCIQVKVIDPETRKSELWEKYRLLPDPHIRNKGRIHNEVFFLDQGFLFMEAFQRYIFTERLPTEEHPYLFTNLKAGPHFGKRLKPDPLRESFSARCTKLGIEEYSPHSLRHFYGVYATNVLREVNPKIDLDVIQQMLGHASVDSTKKYAVFQPGTIRKELEKAYLKVREDGTMVFDEMEQYK